MKHLIPLLLLVMMASSSLAADPSVLFDQAVRDRATSLFEQLDEESAEQVIANLDVLATDSTLSPAQRDAAAWDLLRRMRRLDPGAVPPLIMTRLEQWQPQSFRRHEESPVWQQPLFDVSASARGVQHQWSFNQGVLDAMGRGADTTLWLNRYGADPQAPFARGVRSALSELPDFQLDKLIALSGEDARLADSLRPELWLMRGQLEGLGEWLMTAPEHRVSEILRQARDVLTTEQQLTLGAAMLQHPSASMQSLALARQTELWMTQPDWPQRWALTLWSMRGDPALSAAADLQLIRLGATDYWTANPALAPQGVLGSDDFQHLESLSNTLNSREGAFE